ncbi:MAG: hypothetical protein NTX05_09200 [Fusobacteria bacterium]|nr:hypothetical protein [Fusobacteriota bacterium]
MKKLIVSTIFILILGTFPVFASSQDNQENSQVATPTWTVSLNNESNGGWTLEYIDNGNVTTLGTIGPFATAEYSLPGQHWEADFNLINTTIPDDQQNWMQQVQDYNTFTFDDGVKFNSNASTPNNNIIQCVIDIPQVPMVHHHH